MALPWVYRRPALEPILAVTGLRPALWLAAFGPFTRALVTIAMADGARTGGELAFIVEAASAGGDHEVYAGAVRFTAVRKGTTVTSAIGPIGSGIGSKSHAAADMTVTATCDGSSGTALVVRLTVAPALAPTVLKAHWSLRMLKGHGAIS